MLWYLNQVKRLLGGFHSFMLEQFPQSKNSHVDLLATLATISRENLPKIILVEDYAIPAYDILTSVGVNFMRVGPSWMDPLVAFLKVEYYPRTRPWQRELVGRHQILFIRGSETIQTLVFGTILAVC